MSINKKSLVKRLLKESSFISWSKEMKILKTLFSIFPDEIFWNSLNLKFKLNSLCWLLSDEGRKFLNIEYKKYRFDLQSPQNFNLSLDIDPNTNISNFNPLENNKNKTLKNFLNLW